MKKMYLVFSVLLVLSVLLASCASSATTTPAVPITGNNATSTVSAPATSTTSAPATATVSASATPATAAPVTITLWHGLTGPEEQAMATVVKNFEAANPNITVNMLAVPFDQLQNKFTTAASTGGGPDLLYGPKDWIGAFAQANLIVPLDSLSSQVGLNNLSPAAVDANKYQGKIWALPESTEAVALWYNTSMIKTPPTNSTELLQMAQQYGLALNTLYYYDAGFIYAEGGQLFDSNFKCILDQGNGTIDALNFLKTASQTKNVIASADTATLDAAFTSGKVGMIFEGPWATGSFEQALGASKLAIAAPITMEPNGKTFAPYLGTKNFYLSANSNGAAKDAAMKFMNYITQPASQLVFATTAGHIPANPSVNLNDPILAGFLKQSLSTTYFPNEPEMGAVYTPAGDMITKVIQGQATPQAAVTQATQLINNANHK